MLQTVETLTVKKNSIFIVKSIVLDIFSVENRSQSLKGYLVFTTYKYIVNDFVIDIVITLT